MPIEKQKILIVEDNPEFVDQMTSILGQEYSLLFSSSLKNLSNDNDGIHPDLILLETRLQDEDRCQIYSQLLENLRRQLIPVILMVDSEADEILECLNPGRIDFVTRPIHGHILRARVQTLLEKKRCLQPKIYIDNIS